jgi:hypothetical protein
VQLGVWGSTSDADVAYEKVRDNKEDITWLLLDYQVGASRLTV